MREGEADEAPRPLDVVVPDQPPVLTPGAAAVLLRLFRRRMATPPAPDDNTRDPHPPYEEGGTEGKAS
ncbi:hypothetical protein [Frankia gtarii]|uniref:hypothetical protein n=1 Tax=Frankia gtarii TaxID=2950102 RepID=UPI0021BEBE4A|nr:hypothetical protein [Frankia gtarii]